MQKHHYKSFVGTPFSIRTSDIQNGTGYWGSTRVSVYRDDVLIGEYIRNYPNFGNSTFYPFSIQEQWYALYSSKYTSTRVMKLNDTDIEDWCGEDTDQHFCPTEMYIPRYHKFRESLNQDGEETFYSYYSVDNEFDTETEFHNQAADDNVEKSAYCEFGFLAGCVWGDDSNWKLRYIDLSQILNRKLVIDDRFQYWVLPNMPLKKCIDMSAWEEDHPWVLLTRTQSVNLKTGQHG